MRPSRVSGPHPHWVIRGRVGRLALRPGQVRPRHPGDVPSPPMARLGRLWHATAGPQRPAPGRAHHGGHEQPGRGPANPGRDRGHGVLLRHRVRPARAGPGAAPAAHRREHPGVAGQVAPYLQQQLATGRYPNLQRATSSGADMDNDATFEFILNFILDAVAAQLPTQPRRPTPPPLQPNVHATELTASAAACGAGPDARLLVEAPGGRGAGHRRRQPCAGQCWIKRCHDPGDGWPVGAVGGDHRPAGQARRASPASVTAGYRGCSAARRASRPTQPGHRIHQQLPAVALDRKTLHGAKEPTAGSCSGWPRCRAQVVVFAPENRLVAAGDRDIGHCGGTGATGPSRGRPQGDPDRTPPLAARTRWPRPVSSPRLLGSTWRAGILAPAGAQASFAGRGVVESWHRVGVPDRPVCPVARTPGGVTSSR
jgi:hypothetical protein